MFLAFAVSLTPTNPKAALALYEKLSGSMKSVKKTVPLTKDEDYGKADYDPEPAAEFAAMDAMVSTLQKVDDWVTALKDGTVPEDLIPESDA